MANKPITPKILLQKGFEERFINGQIFYVKNNNAITYSFAWTPCAMEFGVPLCTELYVKTWEEFEELMQEGGKHE